MTGWGVRRIGAVVAMAVALLAVVVPAGHGRPAPAAAGAPNDLVYVAMGDSYTSGPLVLPHDTTWVPQDCAQSYFNYPHLAAAAIGATSFTDVSCGSATIDNLYETQDGLPTGGANPPQLDAVGPDTDVVTLGMGGNDVGFVGLALDCVRLLGPPLEQPCTPLFTAGGIDSVSADIAEVGPELGDAIEAIHAKAPGAEVFIVGYPAALPDDGQACWPYVPILPADMPYLVAKFKEMNAMLAEQAAAHDATYVDVYTSGIGHDACQIPLVAWVNGVVVVPPSFPAHPNQLGLADSGRVVAATIQQRLAANAAAAAAVPAAAPVPAPAAAPPSAPARGPDGITALPITGGEQTPVAALVVLLGALATVRLSRRGAPPAGR